MLEILLVYEGATGSESRSSTKDQPGLQQTSTPKFPQLSCISFCFARWEVVPPRFYLLSHPQKRYWNKSHNSYNTQRAIEGKSYQGFKETHDAVVIVCSSCCRHVLWFGLFLGKILRGQTSVTWRVLLHRGIFTLYVLQKGSHRSFSPSLSECPAEDFKK